MFKKTNLLKVNDICKLNEIKCYYKLINKQQQPQYCKSFTHEINSDIKSNNTRMRNDLHIPKTKHDFVKTNFTIQDFTINKWTSRYSDK